MLSRSELDAHVDSLDLSGVTEWLLHGDPAMLADARKLYETWRGRFRRRYGPRGSQAERLWTDRWWFVGVVAAGLGGPDVAASDIPWADTRWQVAARAEPLVQVASSRDRGWIESFVTAVAAGVPGQDWHRWGGPARFHVMVALEASHDLSVPTGPAYSVGWLRSWSWQVRTDTTAAEIEAVIETLAEDPRMPDVLYRVVHTGWLAEAPRLPETLPELVRRGSIDRDAMVAHCLDALLEDQRPHSQRVLAGALEALDLRTDEIPGGLAFVQGVVATCHGSVGRLLLPYAIELARDEDDLVELCTTIFTRPEKQQRADLVRALADDAQVDRLGRQAVLAGLACLDTVDDKALRLRADRLADRLSRTSTAAPRTALGLWERPLPTVEPYRVPRVPPTLIDTLVAEAAVSGPAAVRARLLARLERPDGGDLPQALQTWATAPGVELLGLELERLAAQHQFFVHDAPAWSLNDLPQLVDAEALDRLGRSRRLLSAPEFADAHISLDELARRITANDGAAVGALDLLLAVLRLRPTDPRAIAALDGTSVPVDRALWPGRDLELDAGDVVRRWVGGGGLPVPILNELGQIALRALPLPQALWAIVPEEAIRPHQLRWVTPGWRELSDHDAAVLLRHEGYRWPRSMSNWGAAVPAEGWAAEVFLHRERELGPWDRDELLAGMCDPDLRGRHEAAWVIVRLFALGDLSPADLTTVAAYRLARGELLLARFAETATLVAGAGGLRSMWPVLAEVADRACRMPRKPAGLADLLRAIVALAPEVPDATAPPAVADLAAAKGTTKSHAEARAWVAAS